MNTNKNLLQTKRLIVKPPSMDYLAETSALDADFDVMRYVLGNHRQEEASRDWLNQLISHYKKHSFSVGFIFEKETGNFIGRAGLIYLECDDTQSEVEIACILHQSSWKKGYGTELTQEIIRWGFKHLAVPRLLATIHPENKASYHLLEKLGAHFLGKYPYAGAESERYEILRG